MTRGSIPRFDLYEELEISRLASVEVIEAAYRALVKRHHPDVSRPDDAERIKRLNVAREWLTSPPRRARYDAATAVPGESTPPASRVRDPEPTGAARRGPEEPPRPARASSPASFGVHSRYVRQFLAHLRELDGPMARELLDARAAIDANAYAAARGAALAASRHGRNDEWTFAREAASVIARGKLHDQALVAGVVAIVADVAGAIVVRDLLPPADFDLLLAPWRGREAPVVERPAAPARSTDPASVARPFLAPVSAWLASVPVTAVVAAIRERRPLAAGISGLMLVTVIGLAVLGSGPSKEESAVAALTAGPPAGAASGAPGDVAAGSGSPSGSGIVVPPSGAAATPSIDPLSSAPPASPTPGQGSFIPVATPRVTATPRPPTAPPPTSVPTSAPTVAPTPPPTPTPSPEASCTVVSLIGVNTSNAQLTWTTAGFTGTVVFGTPIPPQYKIGWQSLNPGDSVPCTSDVTVQLAAP